MREYWDFYEKNRDAVDATLRAVVEKIPAFAQVMRSMSPAQLAEQEKRGLALQRQALVEGNWRPYLEDLAAQAENFARSGIPFSTWLPLFTSFRVLLRGRLFEAYAADPARVARILDGMNHYLDRAVGVLGDAYDLAKERLIGQQQEAIRELSTPILQLREGLLILPVVGLVDTRRARQITESLLLRIRDRRAELVIMDITGVPIVDSKVANHLAQACEAARLMGAQVIVTGISPEIAQALVTIGAEMRGVRTLADLQSGIEEADRLQGFGRSKSLAHEAAAETA